MVLKSLHALLQEKGVSDDFSLATLGTLYVLFSYPITESVGVVMNELDGTHCSYGIFWRNIHRQPIRAD